MKSFTFSLIFFIMISVAHAQIENPHKGKPSSIMESFLYLDQLLNDTAKYTFKTFPEEYATIKYHHGFGTWIRNNWGLWRGGKLKQELLDSGFVHADDMSMALLTAYHRKLNNKPLKFGEMASSYASYWSRSDPGGFSMGDIGMVFDEPPDFQVIMDLFPVGDTIVVYLYAEKSGFFQKQASSVRSMATVKSHVETDIEVEILSIQPKKKHSVKRKEGDIFVMNPLECYLIPPPPVQE